MKLTLNKGGKAESYTITNGTDGKNGTVWRINPTTYMWEYKEDGDTDWKTTTYKAVGEKGETGAQGPKGDAGKIYMPNATTGTFWEYANETDAKNGKNGTDTKISYTSPNAIYGTWTPDYLTLNNVKGADNQTVVISLKSSLKSLVFDPDFYYDGIEAMDLASYTYNPVTVEDVSADKDCKDDAPKKVVDEDKKAVSVTLSPALAPSYFLNPSNAKVSTDASDYSFVVYDKKFTRAGEEKKVFTPYLAEVKDGKVTVHAKYTGPDLKSISTDKAVTVIALQYNRKDTTITSDFAAVRQNKYTNLVLNCLVGTQGHAAGATHLWGTAQAAIDGAAMAQVAWNSHLNLDSIINTHYVANGAATESDFDQAAYDGIAKKAGFKYSYQLVGYVDGANKTSQSAHAALKGSLLRPQMTKDGKQQAYGAEQNKAEIGRMPLVRVILTDTVNNKIAAVGYMKVEITPTQAETTIKSIDAPAITDVYTIGCGSNALEKKFTWSEIEESLIAKLNTSKADFEKNYKLDGVDDDAYQYDGNGNKLPYKDAEKKIDEKPVGTVSLTKDQDNGRTTDVLEWTITEAEAKAAFAAEKNAKTSLTTYIRYTRIAGDGPQSVYVKFTWTPSAINANPTVDLNTLKIEKQWYAANNAAAGTGYNDMHGNIEVIGQNGATGKYEFDIPNVLVGGLKDGKLTAKLAAPYDKLELTPTFKFVSGTCGSDKLTASEDGSKLIYTKKDKSTVEVATLNTATGKVTMGNFEEAKDLLNAYGHTDLANTLTATV